MIIDTFHEFILNIIYIEYTLNTFEFGLSKAKRVFSNTHLMIKRAPRVSDVYNKHNNRNTHKCMEKTRTLKQNKIPVRFFLVSFLHPL